MSPARAAQIARVMAQPLAAVKAACNLAAVPLMGNDAKEALAHALADFMAQTGTTFDSLFPHTVSGTPVRPGNFTPMQAKPVGAPGVDMQAIQRQIDDAITFALKPVRERIEDEHDSAARGDHQLLAEVDTLKKWCAENASNAQTAAEKLMKEIQGVRHTVASVDPSEVSQTVAAAVAQAFKPFEAAVIQAGAQDAIGQMVAARVVERKTAFDVFGIDVLNAKGDPLMVDVWNHPDAPAVDPDFIWTERIIKHFLLSQETGENIWLGGEKGTGKSESARQFAGKTGRSFTRINFHKYTTCEEYIGCTQLDNGQTKFKAGDFLTAYNTPSNIILLDEITNCDAGELALLNGLMEPNAAVNIGGSVWRRAPGVLIFAADNTLTTGDTSGRYAGTREMNSALADRFARIVRFDFLPLAQEVEAVMRRTGCRKELAEHVLNAVTLARAKVTTGDVIDAPSIRSVLAFIRALAVLPVADAWEDCIAARQPAESAAGLAAVYVSAINESLIQSYL